MASCKESKSDAPLKEWTHGWGKCNEGRNATSLKDGYEWTPISLQFRISGSLWPRGKLIKNEITDHPINR